ncbi:sulfotransferase [Persephonella sp. IF05-L8]|uniref:sulfotransferase n=1 Tax=Persephonella sp. IF05-L8 TaxID=1158338 RepID=UPI000496A59F
MVKRLKVNLFIVGAEKSATTFIAKYLSKHKDIYFPIIKEPQFFSTDILPEYPDEKKLFNLPKNKWNEYLHHAYIRDEGLYLELYKDSENYKYRGDASVSYLFSKVAAREIYKHNPDAKIIISLRNPIERAFSAYKMDVTIGRVSVPFEQALKEIPRYIQRSLYFEQVKRYYDIFPKENIHIILFDDLKKDPQKVLNDIFGFLKLEPIYFVEFKRENVSYKPKNVTINYILYKTGIKNFLKKVIPQKYKEKLKSYFYEEFNESLNPGIYNNLLDIFAKDVIKLSHLIDKDLNKWLEKK